MRLVLNRYRIDLPDQIRVANDFLVVLRWSAANAPAEVARVVEDACIAGEVESIRVTEPTPGAHEFLADCQHEGRPVVIVSNNSAESINAYLNECRLGGLIRGVVGRAYARPDLMKPHPEPIRRALDKLQVPALHCVLIGDSVTDIEVALATGVRSIGFAKDPRRGAGLTAAGAAAVVSSMEELRRA